MTHTLPGLSSDHLPIDINLQLAPIRHTNTTVPAFNFKKAYWDEFEKFIIDHPPLPIEEMQNIHCAAQSFSLLLNAAKVSVPFGCLVRSPKAWWSEEAELAMKDRRRAYSEVHRSKAHRLAYVEASRRASSVISTCLPAQTPVLFSTSLTLLLARKVLPAIQKFLTPIPPKTLPTSTLPTSAHTSLSKLPDSLVVLSIVSLTIYAPTNAQTQHFTALSASLSPLRNYNCNLQALNFHCLRPRSYSLSSSNTSTSFSSATSSLHLQLVLVFSHFPSCCKPADSPASYRPISLTFCISKLFERLVLNRLCYYLESKNLISPTQAGFDLAGFQLIKFFSCPNLFGTASKRKELQIELFWPPLISLMLLIWSGTHLSSTNY